MSRDIESGQAKGPPIPTIQSTHEHRRDADGVTTIELRLSDGHRLNVENPNPTAALMDAKEAYEDYVRDQRREFAATQPPEPASEPAQNPMVDSIKGYRKFDQTTSDYINDLKSMGGTFQEMLDRAMQLNASPRELALARTHFQEGAMWLIRSVAKPEGLF